jgi:hypothetical protein
MNAKTYIISQCDEQEELSCVGFGGEMINIKDGNILICDPINLDDVFNDEKCDVYKYIENRGVLVDIVAEGAVVESMGDIILGSSDSITGKSINPNDWALGSDSGTLAILPIDGAPKRIIDAIKSVNGSSPTLLLLKNRTNGNYKVKRYLDKEEKDAIIIEKVAS